MLLRLAHELGCLTVHGPEAKSWLNGVVTCDTQGLDAERGVLGLLLNKQGKVQSDLALLEGGGTIFVSTAPGQSAKVHADLERMLVMEDAELADRSAELAFVFVHGPGALDVVRRCSVKLAMGALDQTADGGAALVVRRSDLEAAARELTDAGAALGDARAWLELRLEGGWPEFGTDYTGSDNAHEASLDRRCISWTKGCYLGQEVVCMQDMRGKVKRRIARLALEGQAAPELGSPVLAAGGSEPIGRVTSVAFCARPGKVLALAMLAAPHFEPGTSITVGGISGRVLAGAELKGAST